MPGTSRVDRARRDQAEHPRHLNLRVGLAGGHVGKAEDRERRRRRLRVPQALDGRDLHLLVLGQRVAALVAEHDDGQGRRQPEADGDGRRALGEFDVPALAAGTRR